MKKWIYYILQAAAGILAGLVYFIIIMILHNKYRDFLLDMFITPAKIRIVVDIAYSTIILGISIPVFIKTRFKVLITTCFITAITAFIYIAYIYPF